MSKASRWIDLVAFLLQHRYPVSRAEIFRKVTGYDGEEESARRKFERDKDELRALGVDIETVALPGAAGDEPPSGYRLRPRNTYLPYLELADAATPDRPYQGLERIVLTRAELEILDRATRNLATQGDTVLARAAASARRKLAFDVPLVREAAATLLALPIPTHARQALAALQEAVLNRTAVTCRYYTMSRRADEERRLEPWALLFQWGRWYVAARASNRDEPRLYRVDRMRDVTVLAGAGARFTVPDEFDVRAFSGRTPWEFGSGGTTAARVRFSFPESHWVMNQRVGTVVDQQPGKSATLAFEVRDEDAFLRWLLSFGRRVAIEAPDTLRHSLDALRADVAALYAECAP